MNQFHWNFVKKCYNKFHFILQANSENYPLEASWYIDTILPVSKPNPDEISMHNFGLFKLRMSIFSYISKKTGLVARYRFAILMDPEKKVENCDRLASNFANAIIYYGGFATIESHPEVRWNAINIVLGMPKPSWGKYCVNLYSYKLVKDATNTFKFDHAARDRYKILMPLRPTLNMHNICQLI